MFTLKDQKNINSRIALLIIFLSFLLLAEPVLAKKEGRRGNKAGRNEVKNTRVSKSVAGDRTKRSSNFSSGMISIYVVSTGRTNRNRGDDRDDILTTIFRQQILTYFNNSTNKLHFFSPRFYLQ